MDLDIFRVFDREEVSFDQPTEVESNNSGSVDRKRKIRSNDVSENLERKKDPISDHVVPEEPLTIPKVVNTVPAKIYPFELDGFQKEAIGYIDREESVLVAAHTSAGKTAVAEYAIAKSLRDKQRVIYTSPIKALSNQKYRDLKEEFGDVGLMTGDMTIAPNATCLIMTTEILRSMLYRGSEVIREVAWVIYDEVHYMRDKERGVVWEESIILLPHKVRFVFLSATIPNSLEFVNWVSKIHQQPCHVVYTDYRPVPLQHFIYPLGAEGLYMVVDEKSRFREENFQKAMSILQPNPLETETAKKKPKATNKTQSDLFKIIRLIMDRDLDPCIVFSFSKKDCETYALQMAKLDFNNNEEKDLVEQVFLNAMEALSQDDQNLPQVVTILPLLKRGIGIHHGGLLPILKEVIEILFQEGLIKCLFATETFSIGINMPAKTVVFTQTRKFDGKDFRWITSGEYIQMSGRAGRRGKDDKGIVIQMLDEKMEPDVVKGMIYGASDPLFSSYHVSYNMLLNMLRVEDADPEKLLKASFHQFQREKDVPILLRKSDELQKEAQALCFDDEVHVKTIYNNLMLWKTTSIELKEMIIAPEKAIPFIQPGRLVLLDVTDESKDSLLPSLVWSVIIGLKKAEKSGSSANSSSSEERDIQVDCLVPKNVDSLEVRTIPLKKFESLSAVKLNLPKDIMKENVRKGVGRTLGEIKRRFESSNVPLLDTIKDMGVDENSFNELSERLRQLESRLPPMDTFRKEDDALTQSLNLYMQKMKLLEESRKIRLQATDSQTVSMKDDVRKMKRVLRRLGYISDEGVLSTKGRFACELSTGDEILITDMIFDGSFNDLSSEQIVGVLSCFVYKEGQGDGGNRVRSEMQAPVRQMQVTARNFCRICVDAKISVEEDEFVNGFNTDLVDVAYAWCAGSKFSDICKLTEIFEGSIIRAIRRLDELLRQLASASASIGNHELKVKFEHASLSIRRGVIFAASLYL